VSAGSLSRAPGPTGAGARAQRIEVEPGLRLFVEVEGAGPPLLLLHGFTQTGRSLASLAAGLRGAHRCLRVDLVGHGESDAPDDASAYTMERCTAQLAALLDAQGVERAHVFGYSMGGRTALALAATRPERVASVLAVGASAGIEDPRARAARVRDDEALAARIEREGVPAFVERWMALPLFATQARLGPAFLARARAERLAQRAHGLALSLRGMGSGAQPALAAKLAALPMPVLLVAGAHDERFAALAESLAARIPLGRAERLAGSGHAAHLEDPEGFLRLARGFFATHARRADGGGASRSARSPLASEEDRDPWPESTGRSRRTTTTCASSAATRGSRRSRSGGPRCATPSARRRSSS
jgi:2-succinyl-6-hydroxy-2,4-cyclohexadiene-1-carboxylate synthase